MNSKLVLAAALILLVSSGLRAKHSLATVNHTPFTIKVHYEMGPFGSDAIDREIDPGATDTLNIN